MDNPNDVLYRSDLINIIKKYPDVQIEIWWETENGEQWIPLKKQMVKFTDDSTIVFDIGKGD